MRIIIGTLFFALVVFPHFTELSSPMRTREQNEFRETEEASTSGRHHTEDSVTAYGRLIPHNKFTGPIPGSGLPEGKYQAVGKVGAVYHKVNNHYELLSGNFSAVRRDHFVYGVVTDGYIRPIYNENAQQIVISQKTEKQFVVTEEQAAQMGFHQHYTQHTWNLQSRNSAEVENTKISRNQKTDRGREKRETKTQF